MKKKYVMALVSILLIVSGPFSVYGLFDDIIEQEQKRDLGEIILVNVDKYEPTTISSDYIRNRNFPISVHLTGMTLESGVFGSQDDEFLETTFGDLKIKNVRIIRQTLSRYVSGVQEHPPAEGYYVKSDGTMDLGYLKLYLRRIPKEEDVPDKIDINLTARVEFDVDSGFGVFGRQDLYFDSETRIRDIWEGRASLEFLSVDGNKANFQLYDGSNNKIGSQPISLRVGGSAHTFSLRDGPLFLDNKVRLKLNGISGDQDRAVFKVGSREVTVVEGMNLIPGSDWVVRSIGRPSVELYNEETKMTKLFSESEGGESIFSKASCKGIDLMSYSELVEYQKKIAERGEVEEEESQSISEAIRERVWKGTVRFSPDNLLEELEEWDEEKLRFYCSAINEYENAIDYSVGDELNELYFKIGNIYYGLRDKETALEYYGKIKPSSQIYNSHKIGDLIQGVEEDIANGVTDYFMIYGKRVYLKEVVPPSKRSSFRVKIDGVSVAGYYTVDSTLLNGVKGNRDYPWTVISIKPGEVKIAREVDGEDYVLKEGKPTLVEITDDKNAPKQTKIVEIESIEAPLAVVVSVLPGDGRNYGTSHFSLHLPIEKSLIQWTPEQIDSMIDSTHSKIEKLEGALDKLGKFIKSLKVACFSVFSFVAIKNAFFVNNKGRKLVLDKYSDDICPELVQKGEYKSVTDCIEKKASEIDDDVKLMSEAIDDAEELMKGYTPDNEQQKENIVNRFDTLDNDQKELFKTMMSEEFRSYTGLNSVEVERLAILSYSDKEQLNKELETDYIGLFEQTQKATEKLEGHSSQVERDSIIKCVFKPSECGGIRPIDNLEGENHEDTLRSMGYNTQDIILINEVIGLGNEKYNVYDGNEFKVVEQIKNNGEEIYINGHPIFTDNGVNIYYHVQGITTDYGSDYYGTEEKKVQYDEKNRVWVFAYRGSKGAFPNSGEANYVVVNYNDDGSRSYGVWNVGKNGKIDYHSDSDDRLLIHPTTLDQRIISNKDEDKRYNYISIREDIDRHYIRINRNRFVDDGHTTADGYIQSKGLSLLSYRADSECINYMSQADCDLLFGFCDPVLCPASRFDLGGRWQVDNVIKSGIIGSIVLGLPNFGPKEPLPICLTGIHAGLDNIKSKFEGFEDCLQKAKATGESVGICNTIRSIYMCEILWKEALAIFGSVGKLADVISGKIFGDSRGGGEYLNWKESWSHLQDSVSFFTTTYARSAFSSYTARNAGEFGSQVCKAAIYGKQPGSGDFIGELLEPTSPYQFTGWFDELPYAHVEGGKSVYRFYYHIYAGRDEDAHYYVYLTGPNLRPLIITDVERIIRRGYLEKGEYAQQSQTVDGPSGYNQMCININNKKTCGFGKVDSSFSMNYLNEMLVNDEANRDINSAEDCVPDSSRLTPSLASLTTPIDYGLVDTGIVRVCSPYDPDGEGTRWRSVGDCGLDENGFEQGSCYMDMDTVSLHDVQNRNALMAQLNNNDINNTSRDAFAQNAGQTNDYLNSLRIKAKGYIENGKFNELLSVAIKLDQFVNSNTGVDPEFLAQAHDLLGDVYAAMGGVIENNVETARTEIIGEFVSKIRDVEKLFKVEDEVNIDLDIIVTNDIRYQWKEKDKN
jgi:tetratricopeptide (TPR) repeat protein